MTGELPSGPLVAWYGDDYTGAAAVMEVLTFAGLPSVLFLDIPTPAQLALFPGCRGIGIAGSARARGPDWMRAELPPVFDFLASSGARVLHYKICSTFDSAPQIGSIGQALELALARIDADWVGLMPAAPPIGRYQAFGTLFAAAGEGVHRLDRHPVMAHHPVTPMDEADICRHLSRQTDLPMGLVALDAMTGLDGAAARLASERVRGARVIALDTVDDRSLEAAGALIWSHGGAPTLTCGSQGVEYALVRHWQQAGLIPPAPPAPTADRAEAMAVVAGSVSATTDAQIAWAEAHGFAGLRLDPAGALLTGTEHQAWLNAAIEAATAAGPFPLLYAARGPADPAIARFRAAAARAGHTMETANAALGAALGDILAGIVARTGCRRAAIAGGDTSSHAAQRLGIFALTAMAATVPGASLCRAYRAGSDAAFEIALKGGQMGSPDFFGRIRNGGAAT